MIPSQGFHQMREAKSFDQTAYPSLEAGGMLGIDARGRSYRIRRATPKHFGVIEARIRFNLPYTGFRLAWLHFPETPFLASGTVSECPPGARSRTLRDKRRADNLGASESCALGAISGSDDGYRAFVSRIARSVRIVGLRSGPVGRKRLLSGFHLGRAYSGQPLSEV